MSAYPPRWGERWGGGEKVWRGRGEGENGWRWGEGEGRETCLPEELAFPLDQTRAAVVATVTAVHSSVIMIIMM